MGVFLKIRFISFFFLFSFHPQNEPRCAIKRSVRYALDGCEEDVYYDIDEIQCLSEKINIAANTMLN